MITKMAKERTQLNINIDPKLLVKLKTEATKRGKTLTDFVVEQLSKAPAYPTENSQLEERLLKIEEYLKLDKVTDETQRTIGAIFTDEGAKHYGEVARQIFESHLTKKKINVQSGLQELATHLKNYPHSNPELVFQILLGRHSLTGKEMTIAYRHGSCAMRSALNDWTNNPLEDLNQAFLDAVVTKSLV